MRIGVEIVEDVLAFFDVAGIWLKEEFVVDADFRRNRVSGRDAVHRGLRLVSIGNVVALAGRIVGTLS